MLHNIVKKPLLQPLPIEKLPQKKPNTKQPVLTLIYTHQLWCTAENLWFLNKGSKTSLSLLQQWGKFRLGFAAAFGMCCPLCAGQSTTNACVCVCLCLCVFVCTAVKVAAAVGINQPAGLFEASVSFHFQKKNLAEANLILLLQGKRGSNQSERLKDRWTERGRKVRMLHIEDSLPSNTEHNKNQASHMIKTYKVLEFLLSNSFICDQNEQNSNFLLA